jgi:hypothetical protein
LLFPLFKILSKQNKKHSPFANALSSRRKTGHYVDQDDFPFTATCQSIATAESSAPPWLALLLRLLVGAGVAHNFRVLLAEVKR